MASTISHEAISNAIAELLAAEATAKKDLEHADHMKRQAGEAYANAVARYEEVEHITAASVRTAKERRKALAAFLALDDDEIVERREEITRLLRPVADTAASVPSPAVRHHPAIFKNTSSAPPPESPAKLVSDSFDLENPQHLSVIPFAPSIVYDRNKGRYVELACCYCHGNCAPDGTPFWGAEPFHRHIHDIHGHFSPNAEITIKLCELRVVPEREIRWIAENGKAGGPYVELVKVDTEDHGIVQHPDVASSTSLGFATDSENYLPHVGCIVKHPDGDWYELSCPICGGNSAKSGKYLQGTKAFYDHLIHAHQERLRADVETVIDRCQKRKLTVEEVTNVKAKHRLDPPVARWIVNSSVYKGGYKHTAPDENEAVASPDREAVAPRDTILGPEAARLHGGLTPDIGRRAKRRRVVSYVGVPEGEEDDDDDQEYQD